MYPVLIEIGGFKLTTFGLMIFLSFLAGAWAQGVQLERRGYSRELAWETLAWVAIAGILGAKLYYLGLHSRDLLANPLRELTARGGLVWYGGLFGGILAFYWQVRKRNLPVAPLFDSVAPALALAYAVGRIGCFLVGDDYGLPTSSWVGIAFPEGTPPSTAGYLRSVGADVPSQLPDSAILAVHPTQLYEVAAALVMFAILWKLARRRLAPGRLFALYLAFYGLERFLVEFVRAKSDRFILGLSTSQMASLVLLGAATYVWQRRRATLERRPAPAHAG
ncbi:MAG: prolipoprotein diacylglyceryl transferase [Gemmatimonadetes bacterium]|nr:prolipoprotein diacylglyceryl transferase [Gemmatimonadota bacterium]